VATAVDRVRVQQMISEGAQLVEVLPAKEYEEDHLPGARSIPLRQINKEGVAALDMSRPLIVYCWDMS
jgi:rhodanese-related sulfurtransferase